MSPLRGLILLASFTLWYPHVAAEITPHPFRVDRWVDTRGTFSVEYTAGQEGWVELTFERLAAAQALKTSFNDIPENGVPPLAFSNIQAHRGKLLDSIAHQIGLSEPTELQGRVFDTFIGYYESITESASILAPWAWEHLEVKHLAIWHRDELTARLREGEKFTGFRYDPSTDRGHYRLESNLFSDPANQRMAEIRERISAQQLDHTFSYGRGKFEAGFSLRDSKKSTPKEPREAAPPTGSDYELPVHIIPIVYPGDFDQQPNAIIVDGILSNMSKARVGIVSRFLSYQDPTLLFIALHETTEAGLVDAVIRSKDRRWLCDGTANYAAWKAVEEVFGADPANQVYNLESDLRRYASLQKKIKLRRWPAAERQKESDRNSELNKAHYAFAAGAMFMLAGHHGEDAIPLLWRDVAAAELDKASAKTFASALKKRYGGNLNRLIRAAEDMPIEVE